MRSFGLIAATAVLLGGCGTTGDSNEARSEAGDAAANGSAATPGDADGQGAGWDLVASGEGAALIYPASGDRSVTLFCPSDRRELLVNVQGFRPVGSEERMSFGSGATVETLVADTRGDSLRGGVSGTGAVPANLDALIGGAISVNYGSQNSGPHPAPPSDLARGFSAACRDSAAAAPAPQPDRSPPPSNVSACLMQDDNRLRNPPLRAIGTEPFWGARIEGRCVTYNHPEDQQGTRIWTKYRAGSGGGGTWSGALEGRLFELTIRPQAGCSDGMSDRRYAYAAELKVWGEVRRGCAERV
jgi:uncharacterized membrane protein